MRRIFSIIGIILALLIAVPLIAQEDVEAQKSGFLKFVEDRLSTPDRRIAINGLEGVISSDVKIAEITVSDAEGVWLRISNAVLNWNQAALLVGQLQINTLSADKIEYIRSATPAEGAAPPSPEATGLTIPELPVAVTLEKLSVPSVTFGEDLFGLGSEIAVDGRLVLAGGSLDTQLDIERLDGPGGTLKIAAAYQKETNQIDLDLILNEPEDGVIVNLLDMEGRPPLSLKIAGSGPVDALETNLTLDAGGKRALTGLVKLARQGAGLNVEADLHGPVADLAPRAYSRFFGTQTRLLVSANVPDDGGFELFNLTLDGGELSLTANAKTEKDGFLNRLNVDMGLAGAGGKPVLLPGGGGKVSVQTARINVDFGAGENWTSSVLVEALTLSDMSAARVNFDLSGAVQNLGDPATRRLTFNGDGAASGIIADDPQIADALGESVGLGFAGLWNAGEALKIVQARLVGKALEVAAQGDVKDAGFVGNLLVRTDSIAPFSGLAGRQLSGALDVNAEGSIALLTGGFDLSLNGRADDLAIGMDAADKVLAGVTTLNGRIGRSENGVVAEGFRIENAQSAIGADGNFSSSAADFRFSLALNDLGILAENASGALSVAGAAKGKEGQFALKLDAKIPDGRLAGRHLTDASLGVTGDLKAGDFGGQILGDGFLDGYRLSLTSGLVLSDGVNRLSDLRFEAGGTKASGTIAQGKDALLTGKLDLYSPDISMLAALFLTEATGLAEAAIEFAPANNKQGVSLAGRVRNLAVAGTKIGVADVKADIDDAFGVPIVDGTLTGSKLVIAGMNIASVDAKASGTGQETAFVIKSALDNDTRVNLAGNLSPVSDGYRVALDAASLVQGGISAKLVQPAAVTISGNTVSLPDTVFDVGGGRINAHGTAGDALDLAVVVSDLPLSVANAIRPDLGLAGTLNGTVKISGVAKDPAVLFDMEGQGVNASAVEPYGVTPLHVVTSGECARGVLRLAALQADGPNGLTLNASGTMPLVGSNGDLQVRGSLPLQIANRFVAERGGQINGTAVIDARVSGSLAKPQFGGSIVAQNAEIVDPLSNLRLQQISAAIRLSGEQAIIENFSGQLATGGSVSASGTLSLASSTSLPADIRFQLNSARYADGNLFVATASGNLSVTGDLMRDPLLSGDVQLEKAEISIPEFIAGDETLVAVQHVGLPNDVAQTLKRIEVPSDTPAANQRPSVLQLNIAVQAPNQVFVRGRGVDAELGGSVRLTGAANNIQPVGGFELIRGRLNILGQRIDFTSGRVTLVGDLNPYINLLARSTATDGTVVFVAVNGPVSNLDITFSSSPELPQDEVLSLLIFKRALGDLSLLQLAKLAGAAAELAGGGNSLVDDLREATGLADIDVITDAEGNAAVRAGAYLQDNVYISVEAGAQGKSKVSIDLDLTDSLKARGSTTNDGENSVGIFYEKDF